MEFVANGVYLYCIGSVQDFTPERVSELPVPVIDGSDAPFRVLQGGELAALVSDTDIWQFEIERNYLMAHHHVLEAAMAIGDILPVSYGTVAEADDDIVSGLLIPQQEQMLANLEFVRGRVELALRVMWDQDRLFEEIVEEWDEIRQIRDAIAGVPEEQSFNERMQLGQLTSQAIEQMREYERDRILQALEPLSVDIQVKPSNSELLVLNGSFLVEREREAEFDEAVQKIAAPHEGRLMFRYLGPLPPANFVSVYVDTEE
jgi:hypothetical protein